MREKNHRRHPSQSLTAEVVEEVQDLSMLRQKTTFLSL